MVDANVWLITITIKELWILLVTYFLICKNKPKFHIRLLSSNTLWFQSQQVLNEAKEDYKLSKDIVFDILAYDDGCSQQKASGGLIEALKTIKCIDVVFGPICEYTLGKVFGGTAILDLCFFTLKTYKEELMSIILYLFNLSVYYIFCWATKVVRKGSATLVCLDVIFMHFSTSNILITQQNTLDFSIRPDLSLSNFLVGEQRFEDRCRSGRDLHRLKTQPNLFYIIIIAGFLRP